MKKALEKTPKHDFVLPGGEVRKVTLCSTGRPEVFIRGTEPERVCGNGETPAPRVPAKPKAPALAPAAAVPTPVAVPTDAIGDGTTFQTLQNYPSAAPVR